MKKANQKVLSLLLILCVLLAPFPGIGPQAEAGGSAIRNTMLSLDSTSITYQKSDGTTVVGANPKTTDISDSAEGWSWNSTTKTMVLDGINLVAPDAIGLKLPPGSTIILTDGSVNTVMSTYAGEDSNGGTNSFGIICDGLLTIQGAGGLSVVSGTSNIAFSLGIYARALTISGGNINATGGLSPAGESAGIYILGPVNITGGTVTAFGGPAIYKSFGIYATNATFSGGTTYARTSPSLSGSPLFAAHSVSAGNTISDDNMTVLQNDGSDYTLAVTENRYTSENPMEPEYYHYATSEGIAATDIMITQGPVADATVSNKIITGVVGKALSGNSTITVTLSDYTFSDLYIGADVSDWFASLPAGLAVKVSSFDTDTTDLTFSGTPTEVSNAVLSITIPENFITAGSELSVATNNNTRFSITLPVQRTTLLNLADTSVSYTNVNGGPSYRNPTQSDITDTGEGWSWYKNSNGTYAAKTLVLHGINLSTNQAFPLILPAGSTIELADDTVNIVTSTLNEESEMAAISSLGELTIKGGTGILRITGGSSQNSLSMAIFCHYNINISGGTIIATGGSADTISAGIYSENGSINISGGNITSTGGQSNGKSAGLYTKRGPISISGGNITAEGGAPASESYGIYGTGEVSVTGGNLRAIGNSATALSSGIYAYGDYARFSEGTVYAASSPSAPLSFAVCSTASIIDKCMLALQKDDTEYTVPLSSFGSFYVYNTNTKATDIKISPAPVSFSGSGTEEAPYLISSPEQLKEMSDRVNYLNDSFGGSHYKLTSNIILNADITGSPEQWAPIGTGYFTTFKGVFDGNGHTISGLFMDGDAEYAGLFGYISGGTVKNLGLMGGYVATGNPESYAGGIAGFSFRGTIEDCYNTGTVEGVIAGGIVGNNLKGHIQDSYNSGTISSSGSYCVAGGIAGENFDADLTIVNCYNTGTVTADVSGMYAEAYMGGITGKNIESSIKNCYSTGTLSANAEDNATAYVGGIIGKSEPGPNETIENVYWLSNTAVAGIGYKEQSANARGATDGTTAMTEAEMRAPDFVQTLNSNVDELRDTYGTISTWKMDASDENLGYPLFGTEPVTYTLNIIDGGIGAAGGGSHAAGTAVTVSAGTKSGYTFSNWTASGGSFADANSASTTFTMPAANVIITANWTVTSSGGSNPSPGNSGNSGNSGGTEETAVLVNGQPKSAGSTKTDTGSDGRTVKTVTVDSEKLKALLATEKSGARVEIPVTGSPDKAAGKLSGEMVRSMEDKSATLIIHTGTSTYTLPASEINIAAVSQQLGTNVSLSDITVTVSISKPSSSMVKVVESAGEKSGFSVMAPAVDFNISCAYGEKTVDVSNFNAYVERMIAIPEGVDPSKITTGVVVAPDGTVYHVPTRVTIIDGKYYAVINSLTNSTYSVIWNPLEFSDVTRHWAKNAINNMGSRMVVKGIGENSYNPDRAITRAEFAAIIVKALGLKPGMGSSSFSDVNSSMWYSGYIKTAVSYGIIKGYNAAAFGPEDSITREQAITMIANATRTTGLKAELTDSDIASLLGTYEDGASVAKYAGSSMAACLKTGIVLGRPGNLLAPKTNITRAETAVLVEKLLLKSGLI